VVLVTAARGEIGPALAPAFSPPVGIVCTIVRRSLVVTAIDVSKAKWLPESDGIAYLRARHVRGNMLTYFDWGSMPAAIQRLMCESPWTAVARRYTA
jgi:hypothetical protein